MGCLGASGWVRFWAVGLLVVLSISGWIGVHYGWSGAGNIRTTLDHSAVFDAVLNGERSIFRWEQEWHFAVPILLASLPALYCPLLLAPGIFAWLYLVVFSDFEPMAPGNGGLHYLSVVAPFWLGALALGMGRLERSGQLTGVRGQLLCGESPCWWRYPIGNKP